MQVGEDFQSLGLVSEVKEMYVCEGAKSSYSFLHLSIQEFLAAWHVSRHPQLEDTILRNIEIFKAVVVVQAASFLPLHPPHSPASSSSNSLHHT